MSKQLLVSKHMHRVSIKNYKSWIGDPVLLEGSVNLVKQKKTNTLLKITAVHIIKKVVGVVGESDL